MAEINEKSLIEASVRVRERILRMSTNGGAFAGAALSCADVILYLYKHFLNVSKDNLNSEERDYFFLSKGHAVPALYGTFVEIGFLEEERLANHLQTNDLIYWHPNATIPGVEFHSGSLGHLLPLALGVAIDCKLKETSNRVVVVVGDGELNEGSNWEAILIAAAFFLDNLVVVIDRNHFQANMRTEDLIPIEPINKKFKNFGWKVKYVDGHDFNDLNKAFSKIPFKAGAPNCIIADTIRGKGVIGIEERADKWYCNMSEEELSEAIKQLHDEY